MNILIIASEAYPYCKTGALADVVYGLARQLNRRGDDARVIIPAYRGILDPSKMKRIAEGLEVQLWNYKRPANIWKPNDAKLPFFLVENEFYFERENFYGYVDDYERFIFFCRSALAMLKSSSFQKKEKGWFPDVIHGYNALTGLIPAWLPEEELNDPRFSRCRFILSLHNLSHTGRYNVRALQVAMQENYGTYAFEKDSEINMLGRGILNADKVIVSTALDEGCHWLPPAAAALEPLLKARHRSGGLECIPNGIDYLTYDPDKDPFLEPEARFSEENPEERIKNKIKLQHDLGFREDQRIPLMGIISRIREDRGFGLLEGIKSALLENGCAQLIILTEDKGDEALNAQLSEMLAEWKKTGWQGRNPWMEILYGYDEGLARRIYAGCDLILMPFRHIPSGTQQYIAMRYGATPVVYETSVLQDSVVNFEEGMNPSALQGSRKGVGFTFKEYSSEAFCEAVTRAVEVYGTHTWQLIQDQNMSENFSWKEPARLYTEQYDLALNKPRHPVEQGKPPAFKREAQLMQAIMEIDGLPGIALRSPRQMFHQAARLVRWLTEADSVYFWLFRKDLPPLEDEQASLQAAETRYYFGDSSVELVDSHSLAAHGSVDQEEMAEAASFLNKQAAGSWQEFVNSETGELCRPIQGIGQSQLGKIRGWCEGRSVTITAHSRVLGRLDVLFSKPIPKEDEAWYDSALTTLASSFGLRLETIRYAHEKDESVALGSALIEVHDLSEAAQLILEHSKAISGAEQAWLFLVNDGKPVAYDGSQPPEAALEVACLSRKMNDSIYHHDWATSLNGRRRASQYRSFLAFPLGDKATIQAGDAEGIVVVASKEPNAFTLNHEHKLVNILGPFAASTLKTNLWRKTKDEQRLNKLTGLAQSLVGGVEFDELLKNAVHAIATALNAEAASLYLTEEEDPGKLRIRATDGYHNILIEHRVTYNWGDGMTGFIAKSGAAIKFDSLEEMHNHPAWKGLHRTKQKDREPNAFIGFPLKVTAPLSERENQVIGVLKLEDRQTGASPTFTEEDFRLGEMMANMLATVVHNTRLADARLIDMNANLQRLSATMTLSLDQSNLFQRIIQTTAEIVGAEAASLYLLDEDGKTLRIHAAIGYQEILMTTGKAYDLFGGGVTAAIAREGQLFNAKSLEHLHNHPHWEGANNLAQNGHEPNAFLGVPLIINPQVGEQEIIGVLKVEDIKESKGHPEKHFTSQDEALVQMMGSAMATVIKNTRMSSQRLESLNDNLNRLSAAMTGGMEQNILFQRIIDTITTIMRAKAASLYLLEPDGKTLRIRAASGYQRSLLLNGKTYDLHGPGVTPAIARERKLFKTRNLDELHAHPFWAGRNNEGQGGHEPNAFLGIPLQIDRGTGTPDIIGILKVEDIQTGPGHPAPEFTEQDVVLVQMMGSAIVAVIENTRLADQRLLDMNTNLQRLSVSMTGGMEQNIMVQRIVDTITAIMRAKAASLYLLDADGKTLCIRAASGYQSGLMSHGKTYDLLGKGVTASIARNRKIFKANNLTELHAHPDWAGANNNQQNGQEPNAFLGIPLIINTVGGTSEVIGVLKVEDIQPGPGHPDNFFTDQDVVLVQMMGTIIAANLHNTRQSNARLVKTLSETISANLPLHADMPGLNVWPSLLQTRDMAVYEAFAGAFYQSIQPDDYCALEEQTQILLKMGLPVEFYQVLTATAPGDLSRRWFETLQRYYGAGSIQRERLIEALLVDREWQAVLHATHKEEAATTGKQLTEIIARACRAKIVFQKQFNRWQVFEIDGALPPTMSGRLNAIPHKLPVLVYPGPEWRKDSAINGLKEYFSKAQHGAGSHILLLALALPDELIEQARRDLHTFITAYFVDALRLGVKEIQDLVYARDPQQELLARLLKNINLKFISPYQGAGPTPGSMFFGREEVLRDIITNIGNKSFCIIGGRKVGKTSILYRLHLDMLGAAQYRSVYFSLEKISSYEELLSQPITSWQPEPPANAVKTLGDLLENPESDKKIVLLLDEVDKILPQDAAHDWRFLNRLRGLNNEGRIRVVLSGEMALNRLLKAGGDALYNFPARHLLKPLTEEAVSELVTSPMQDLQIELVNPGAITKKIFRFSAGHPAVVQYICGRLIALLNQQHRRQILVDDVDKVTAQTDFQQDEFLNLYWERATNLEKILSIVMADKAEPFSLTDIQAAILKECKLKMKDHEVIAALDALVEIRSIFNFNGGSYTYNVPAFKTVLSNTAMRDLLLRDYTSRYSNENT